MLVLLVIIYRSPIMAAIPLLSVGLVFQLAGAVVAWYAIRFDLSISAQAAGIMTVVLFGTGTDYVLFVSARFREELTRHDDRHEAMRRTMRGVGGAVASAGATILVACAALGLATLRSYQALGPVIAIAVALMMLAALTLIPAVLTIFGRRAFWPMQPRLETSTTTQADWRRAFYGRVGTVVLHRPGLTLAVTVVGLAVLVAGLVSFRTNYDQLESLGNAESVRSFELLRGGFPAGALSPTQLYVSLPPGTNALDPVALEQLDILTLELTGHPAVADASGPTRPLGTKGPAASQLPAASAQRFVSADGRAGRIDVVLKTNPFSQEAIDVVPELRTLARQGASAVGLPPESVIIGGDTAEAYDTRTAGNRDSLVVLPLILLAIGVVLALLLRSLIAPLYLMATIAFTYFATLGLTVAVFVVMVGHAGVGPASPVLPVRVPERAERRLQHLSDVAHPRGGTGSSAQRGDPPCTRAHWPGHYLCRDHPRWHVLRAHDPSAPGSVTARIRGCSWSADRHLHHAHADSTGAGVPAGPMELVAFPHRLLTVRKHRCVWVGWCQAQPDRAA